MILKYYGQQVYGTPYRVGNILHSGNNTLTILDAGDPENGVGPLVSVTTNIDGNINHVDNIRLDADTWLKHVNNNGKKRFKFYF